MKDMKDMKEFIQDFTHDLKQGIKDLQYEMKDEHTLAERFNHEFGDQIHEMEKDVNNNVTDPLAEKMFFGLNKLKDIQSKIGNGLKKMKDDFNKGMNNLSDKVNQIGDVRPEPHAPAAKTKTSAAAEEAKQRHLARQQAEAKAKAEEKKGTTFDFFGRKK